MCWESEWGSKCGKKFWMWNDLVGKAGDWKDEVGGGGWWCTWVTGGSAAKGDMLRALARDEGR